MRFASLGSGSQGNALIVEVGATRLMLDCGFSLRELSARLARIGLSPQDLTAILITHEHSDHIRGVLNLARRFYLPVCLTHGTLKWLINFSGLLESHGLNFIVINSYTKFSINDIQIEPYAVPHDAREPVQFVFGDGRVRLGVLTDAGSSTPHIEATLSGCDALLLECNHDLNMLWNGFYAPGLKKRVAGRYGHLDNDAAGQLLRKLDNSRLQHLIALHISQHNNTPHLARRALSAALGCTDEWVSAASQDEGFAWRQIA